MPHAPGTGTSMLRPWVPTLSSAQPLPFPPWGSRRRQPDPWWAPRALKGPVVRTIPQAPLSTPVALSRTALVGTPPANPDAFPGPRQAHPASSPGKACASPTPGCGNVGTEWPSPA